MSDKSKGSLRIPPQPTVTDEQAIRFEHFRGWCAQRGIRDFPSSPVAIASFLAEAADGDVIPYCESVGAVQDALGLASPIQTHAVRTVLARLPCPDFPRSWNGEDRAAFLAVDPITRKILLRREQERDTALRRAQNVLSDERKRLGSGAVEPTIRDTDRRQRRVSNLDA